MKRVFACIAAVAALLITTGCSSLNQQDRVCRVDSKDRGTDKNNGSGMRVYTDCGTFVINDAASVGQFNSGDLYARLEPGKTYNIRTGDYRVPFLSMFPNIIGVEEVSR